MKCESTDLEIETIVNRIRNADMDLILMIILFV